ncbi:MAG: hypothetical protein RBG13Loki_1713 [Promethearchaeota archaeon CR_4]|nr:MAG: hypothetical protein RBG13Loki_1713 [Candidatus Lokiarchaeota archaeon CR_4]
MPYHLLFNMYNMRIIQFVAFSEKTEDSQIKIYKSKLRSQPQLFLDKEFVGKPA